MRSAKSSDDPGCCFLCLLLLAACFTLSFIEPCVVSAQDDPEFRNWDGDINGTTPCPGAADLQTLEHEGEAGFWFPSATTRCMTERLRLLPIYVRRIHLLQERLTLTDSREDLLREQLVFAIQAEETAVGALEAAIRGKREAEEERDSWRRSRALWFTIGAVVLTAFEVVAVWAYSRLDT